MSVCIKKVICIVDAMAAFQKDRNVKAFIKFVSSFFHRVSICDSQSGERFSFWNIGCDDLCKRKEFLLKCLLGIFVHQTMSAGGDHNRIREGGKQARNLIVKRNNHLC